jgi:hypothetical protein
MWKSMETARTSANTKCRYSSSSAFLVVHLGDGWFGDRSANKFVPHPVLGKRFFLLASKRKGKTAREDGQATPGSRKCGFARDPGARHDPTVNSRKGFQENYVEAR